MTIKAKPEKDNIVDDNIVDDNNTDDDLFEAEEITDDELSQLDEKMDPVGKEDDDVDNDGDSDESDEYLANRRKTVAKAVKEAACSSKKKKVESSDEEEEDEMDEEVLDEKMTAAEKKEQEKYRKSAAGKKAQKMYDKEKSKPGYHPDKERSKIASKAAKRRVEEADLKDDINALTEGEDLSEEFKEKAQTIFESVINAKVAEITEELETEADAQILEITKEILDEANAEIETSVDFIVEQVNQYMDYVVKEWMEDNQIAIDSSLKSEITEDFISGLKTLFNEHYMEVPEEKTDIVQELADRVEELKDKVNESIEDNMRLRTENDSFKRAQIIHTVSEGLSLAQKEKLITLSEEIDFTSPEKFEEKVTVLKNSYFGGNKKNNDSSSLNEDLDTLGENTDTSKDVAPKARTKMDIYADAVKYSQSKI